MIRLAAGVLLALLSACTAGDSENELAAYQGQWLLVNYWAQWCKPCIEEMPELNRVNQELADVAVVGVNFDGAQGAALQQQVEALGVGFPTLGQDPAVSLGTDRPQVLPTTLVVNPQGELVRTLLGPQTYDSLTAAIATP